jgi:ABC-2 type transport system ATP-binding protein
VIECHHLTKAYGSFFAVNGLDLQIPDGEIFGFLGPNGAGKTTTIQMMIGLLRPTSGQVLLNGLDVERHPVAVKRQIGYVPDEPYLYDRLTPVEFLQLICDLYHVDPAVRAHKIERLLTFFELADSAGERIGGFSHGMRQKVALAAALIHDPRVLFLDEPTVGLDPRAARQLKDTLVALAQQGATVILCTHILEIAEHICDRVAIIDHGRLVADGTLAELRQRAAGGATVSLEDIFLQLTDHSGVSEEVQVRNLLEG